MLLRPLLLQLARALRTRSTSELFRLLDNPNNIAVVQSARANTRDFQRLLILIAEAIELGYPNHILLKKLIDKLPAKKKKQFPVYLAKGVLAARRGKSGAALFFKRALSEKSVIDKEHVAFARFCLSNAWRKRGRYEEALLENNRARRLAAVAATPEIEADIAVAEAWLHFHKNDPSEASRLLDQAEAALQKTGNHCRLADICSARGRIEQRAGRLTQAEPHYQSSLSWYRHCPVPHRGKGRTLINLAKLKWLQSRSFGLKIDELRMQLSTTTLATYDLPAVSLDRINVFLNKTRRGSISLAELIKLHDLDRRQYSRNVLKSDQLREQRAILLKEAYSLLDEADHFYATHTSQHNFRGIGRAKIIRTYLLIEQHEWTLAIELANQTFNLGKQHNNPIIQARAKIVETMARVQECWYNHERSPNPGDVADILKAGREAVDFSHAVQDSRIKIKAHTWYGFAELLQSPPNTVCALDAVKKIEGLLIDMPDDYVTEDADMLKRQCVKAENDQNNDLVRLAQIFASESVWAKTAEAMLNLKIEVLLRQNKFHVNTVARVLKIHPRRVRPVRDRLLYVHGEPKREPRSESHDEHRSATIMA